MTPLPHAPGARMVVITKTSSHEPARQPASQASQLAIPPPSQPPASRPASQPATASQPAEAAVARVGPTVRFKGAEFLAEFVVEANSDKFGKFVLQNSASFLVPTKTNSASFPTKTCRILADGNLQLFPK